jgi:cytochrome c-type biogenesis protein CcmH/NrfF
MLEGRKVGKDISGRREFLGTVTLSVLSIIPSFQLSNAVQDSLPDSGPAGKLWDPARAGPSIPPTTAGDNNAAIQAIEKRLKCTCGCGLDVYTCRTTDFTCPVSPGLHRKVMAMAGAGMSGEQIIADFVRENGVVMLMAPPARGFNLTAYLLPGLAIVGTGAALVFAILRWARRRPAEATAGVTSAAPATAAELDQLRHELDSIDA